MRNTSASREAEGAAASEAATGETAAPSARGPGGRWRSGGPSPNPRGRPRRGDALAEAIRAEVSPQELIAVARAVIEDGKAPASVKLQAATFLAERGYARPTERHELVMGATEPDEDLSGLTLAELAELEQLEARRAAILAGSSGSAPAATMLLSDGDSPRGTRRLAHADEESRG